MQREFIGRVPVPHLPYKTYQPQCQGGRRGFLRFSGMTSTLQRCFWAGISPAGEVFAGGFHSRVEKNTFSIPPHHSIGKAPSPPKSKEIPLKGLHPRFTPGETEAQGCSLARKLPDIASL